MILNLAPTLGPKYIGIKLNQEGIYDSIRDYNRTYNLHTITNLT